MIYSPRVIKWLNAWLNRPRCTHCGSVVKKAAAGWYPDPRGEAPYRWFDGTRWDNSTTTTITR